MRILSLNIWGGSLSEPLLAFLAARQDVDICCFQEVYHQAPERVSTDDTPVCLDILSKIETILPNHRSYFRPVVDDNYGLATLVRRDCVVKEEGSVTIYDNPDYPGRGPTHSRILQWVELSTPEPWTIANVHGLWNGKGKGDSEERVAQSQRINEFVAGARGSVVVCGDLNLSLESASLKLLEERLDNLIRRFNITSTRTSLYTKQERMADYFLASPDLRIKKFEVLEAVVSDHTPLIAEFV